MSSATCIEESELKQDNWYRIAEEMLSRAGITINGNQPYDLQVKNPQFFHRVLQEGSLGLGRATWMAGGSVSDWIFSSSAF